VIGEQKELKRCINKIFALFMLRFIPMEKTIDEKIS